MPTCGYAWPRPGAPWSCVDTTGQRFRTTSRPRSPGWTDGSMSAPRAGWLGAVVTALAVLLAFSLIGGTALDTLVIDLRHRWVVATAPAAPAAPDFTGEPI